jgi:competence protein ComEA
MSTDSRPLLAFVALTCTAFGSAVTFGIDHLNTPKPIIISGALDAQPQQQFLNVTSGSSTISQDPQIPGNSVTISSGGRTAGRSHNERSSSKKIPTSIIHLNSATAEQLEELPGVGPSTAQRILNFRSQSGGFQSVNELGDVPRLGAKKLAKIMPYVAL